MRGTVGLTGLLLLCGCATAGDIRGKEPFLSFTGRGDYAEVAECVVGEVRLAMSSPISPSYPIFVAPDPQRHRVNIDTAIPTLYGGSAGMSQWGAETRPMEGGRFQLDVKAIKSAFGKPVAPVPEIRKAVSACAADIREFGRPS